MRALPVVDVAVVTGRWTGSRKEALLSALRWGEITIADACERYDLSAEEIASWQRRFARHGRAGLQPTKLQLVSR